MGDSPRGGRYSYSPSPNGAPGRSRSRSPPPYKSSRDEFENRDADDVRDDRQSPAKAEEPYNPGNNLYVTGLSTRVTEKELKEFFGKEGKVVECRLVVDPRSHESRGFGFVTMATLEDAEQCIKRLHHSNLEGRIITVEKAKRKRARTPTPGRYLGSRSAMRSWGGRRGDHRDDYHRSSSYRDSSRRSPRYSPYRGGRDGYDRDRSYSPHRHRREYERDRSPEYGRRRSPDYGRRERDRSPPPPHYR